MKILKGVAPIRVTVIITFFVGVQCGNVDESQGVMLHTDAKSSLAAADKAAPSGTSSTKTTIPAAGHSFYHGFIAAVAFIIVSELGDKTFFIAAIMSMRHSRFVVFSGAITALAVMTVLSAAMGLATSIVPPVYTHYLAITLFLIFGLRMFREAYYMSPTDGLEEYEEVQRTISRRDMESGNAPDVEAAASAGSLRSLKRFSWRAFFQAFSMTFIAEWGDRSQIATVALAAKEGPVAVTCGAILGHSFCTLLAVVAGRMVAQKVSVRTVTFVGGIVFLIFALTSLVLGPDKS